MDEIKKLCFEYLFQSRFDHLSVGVIDFKKSNADCVTCIKSENEIKKAEQDVYFDIASVTKPMTLAQTFQTNPEIFDEDMKLLLEHRAGIPAWGLLPKTGWKDIINQYQIQKAETLYSDFSALRLQLEIEKKSGKPLKEITSPFWDSEVKFWKDLKDQYCPPSGFRSGKIINGQVHDPNAFVIDEFCSHAGLFSTVSGLCKTFINLNEKTDFVSRVGVEISKRGPERFILGYDTTSKDGTSLAGPGHSSLTFGHLGFTGTSIWIDSEKMVGNVILSNATKSFWYDKTLLNKFRKEAGKLIWQSY
jgi:CubicO group peptidase (beta-lactamase class C family)